MLGLSRHSLAAGAAAALLIGASILPVPAADHYAPPQPKKAKGARRRHRRSRRGWVPKPHERDHYFEAKVRGTNAITHPRHVHPARFRGPVTAEAIQAWKDEVGRIEPLTRGRL